MQTIDFATFEPHHIHACREDFLGNSDYNRFSNYKEIQYLTIQNAVDFGVRLIKNMAAEEIR